MKSKQLLSQRRVLSAACFERPKMKARARTPRHQLEAMRHAPESICFDIKVNGITEEVEVLRPVHPGDNLFVAYQAEMLTAVLHLLRASGFEKAPSRSKPANLPKGIWQRKGGGFIVNYKKSQWLLWLQVQAHFGCSCCLPGRHHC